MTEQEYKEMTLALKHSGIPLDIQKEFQRLLDKEFIRTEQSRKKFTMKCEREGR